MNWEVAGGIADYLLPHINAIRKELLSVLEGNDDNWKYWILSALLKRCFEQPASELMAIVKRIATKPTELEQHECVDELAKEIMVKYSNSIQ